MVTAPTPEGTTPHDRPTVLCIDDDPLVLHFYRSFLDPRGYRTLTAADGLQGIAIATQDRPDVILLDVMLRGLSGYDICRKLRADPVLHAIPIILLTAWDNPSVAETGRAAGATRTLRKPADPETILTTLAEVLASSPIPPRV
jgi:CheY-like chemotaxis protein